MAHSMVVNLLHWALKEIFVRLPSLFNDVFCDLLQVRLHFLIVDEAFRSEDLWHPFAFLVEIFHRLQ